MYIQRNRVIPFSIWVIGRENHPWAEGLSCQIIINFQSTFSSFFSCVKDYTNYTTSTVVVWRRKFLIAVLQKSSSHLLVFKLVARVDGCLEWGSVPGTPYCDIIQIHFEDNTSTILFFIPLYTIFLNTLGNPAQVKSAPS